MGDIKIVELEITNVCTHKCPYCYVPNNACSNKPYFSDVNTLYKIVEKLSKYEVEMIALLGGDPVMHPQIVDIMKYIKKNTEIKVSLMSNTLQIRSVENDEWINYVDNVDFTLHGYDEFSHESFCGAESGLYNYVIEKLKKMKKRGITVNIAINLIPNTYNKVYDMVKALIDKGLHFDTLLLQRIVPVGRATGKDNFNLNKNQIDEAFKQIELVEKDFDIDISFEDPFPLCVIDPKYHKYMKGCPEGITRMPVKGDGRVSSCGVTNEMNLGNILTDSYEKIWEKNVKYEQFRKASYLTDECIDCVNKDVCRGGCPIQYLIALDKGISFKDKFFDE